MRVILRENVENLGRTGDLVKVSDGYARNFLLPRKLVTIANEKNVAELEHHRRILEKKRLKEKAGAEELATRISEHSCTLTRKVGKNDKLFGSVTPGDIADELSKAGFEVKKTAIQLKNPIKTLGVHPVKVKLQPDVVAELKVWVAKLEE